MHYKVYKQVKHNVYIYVHNRVSVVSLQVSVIYHLGIVFNFIKQTQPHVKDDNI